jgi:hypothetical protein
MKLKIIFNVILVLIAVALLGINYLQPNVGPHNGSLQKAGTYYIEMKSMHQEIHAYLLDKRMEPIGNKGISCEVKLLYADSSCLIKPLKPFGNDGFSTGIPYTPYFYCRVSFKVSGKVVTAGFENQNLIVQKD